MRILGIDHGTKHVGWAVADVDDGQLGFYAYGNFELPRAYPEYIQVLRKQANAWMDEYKPHVVALEEPKSMRSGRVTMKLMECYFAVLFVAYDRRIPVLPITPQSLKIAVTGYGKAEKHEVAEALAKQYGLEYDEIAQPVYYRDKKRAGIVKERMYDTSDACGLCVAAFDVIRRNLISTESEFLTNFNAM